MNRLYRVLGAVTVLYSLAIIARPKLLAAPCGIAEPDGSVSPGVRSLVTSLGARDVLVGAAMAALPPGPALRAAVITRVACDWSDAVAFGTTLPDPGARRKAAGVAVAWGALCALSGRLAGA